MVPPTALYQVVAPAAKVEPFQCLLAVVSTIEIPVPAVRVPPEAEDAGIVTAPWASAVPLMTPDQLPP